MKTIKILILSVLGNALELYNFTLYAIFATKIANVFFPLEDSIVSILASFGIFATGFITRPLGAIIFGYLGDKYGRKYALSISILLMAFPTIFIGLLPGYQTLGIIAPLLLICCRLIQGVCIGGEHNGAAIFAIEHIGNKYTPGFVGGLVSGSCFIGTLLGALVGSICLNPIMPSWAWRIAFLLGGCISFIVYFIRKKITETPQFIDSKEIKTIPLLAALKNNKKSLIVTFTVGSLDGVFCYTLLGFMNIYLSKYLGFQPHLAILLSSLASITIILLCPINGYLAGKIGNTKFLILANILIICSAIPLFMLFTVNNVYLLIIAFILLGILTATILGPQHAFFQELFPVRERYSGIAISYCLGVSLAGGTTPIILTILVETLQNQLIPAFLLMSYSLICLLSILYFLKPFQR